MRKHIILFFSALLFLFACKRGNNTTDVLDNDEMTRLLADVHIVDGSVANQLGGDSLYKYGTAKYMYVFKQYHTDSTQFKASLKYYAAKPEELLKIYNGVNRILQKKADSLNKAMSDDATKKRKEAEKAVAIAAKKLKADSVKIKAKKDSVVKAKKDSVAKALKNSKAKKDSTAKKLHTNGVITRKFLLKKSKSTDALPKQ